MREEVRKAEAAFERTLIHAERMQALWGAIMHKVHGNTAEPEHAITLRRIYPREEQEGHRQFNIHQHANERTQKRHNHNMN